MKHKIIVFGGDIPRIITTDDVSKYDPNPNTVVDPDLGLVKNLAVEFWKLKDGKVMPMERDEAAAKHWELHEKGVIEKPRIDFAKEREQQAITRSNFIHYVLMVTALILGMILGAVGSNY